ncbi:di/tricarboxylate transporter [Alteromonadaceae bacterium 2753L.S.0a.02]|nr:di/tricarboxylate transporter [Alteromonadaceae bacterium 2753L.S.0a.02]
MENNTILSMDDTQYGVSTNLDNTTCIINFMTACPLFSRCRREDKARSISLASVHQYQVGEVIVKRGEPAAELFYLLDGELELQATKFSQSINCGFCGEEAVMGMRTYLTDIRATKISRVVVMPRAFIRMHSCYELFKTGIVDNFHQRLSGSTIPINVEPAESELTLRNSTVAGWLLALLVPLLVFFGLHALSSQDGLNLNDNAITYSAILGTCAVMWVFRLLPDYITALYSILSAVLMGIAPADIAFSGFSSDSFFLAMGILGLSVVIKTSGLSYRIFIKLLRIGPASKIWYNLSFFTIGGLLTPFIPTTNGRITLVANLLPEILTTASERVKLSEGPRLKMSLLHGTSLLSPLFVSSKSVNFIVLGMLPLQVQESFQWVSWFMAAAITGAVMVALYALVNIVLFRNSYDFKLPKSVVREQDKLLGRINGSEWSGLIGLLVLLLGLTFSSVHKLDIAWVSMAILFYLMMFGFLGQRQFRASIDWSFLVFLGALIGMVNVIRETGINVWLAQQMDFLVVLMDHSPELFVLVLAITISAVRVVLPINATVIIFATLLIPLAANVSLNPWIIGFLILLFSESFYLPYQASYYSLFVELTKGTVVGGERKMLLLNITLLFIKLLAVYISFPYWISLGLLK